MRELKTTNLSDFRVGWDLLQGPGKYVHDSCWGAQGFFLEAYRYNREKKRGVGRQLLRFWVSLTEGKWGSYKLCWTWGMEKTKPIFFSRLLCLDAFICIHNVCSCNSPCSESCRGNSSVCCFHLKAGWEWHLHLLAGCWTGSQRSWVPSCLGCWHLPLPEVPLAGTIQAFHGFIYLFITDWFVCVPVVGQPPSPCLATSGIHNIYFKDSSHIQGLSSHLAVHSWHRLPLPTSQRDSRPLPASPKFLCSSCHLPLGVSISFLTPGLPCWLQDGLSLWLYLCGSVIATSPSGKC